MTVFANSPCASERFAVPPEPVLPLTVEQYHEMARAGILRDSDRIELREGWLVGKMTEEACVRRREHPRILDREPDRPPDRGIHAANRTGIAPELRVIRCVFGGRSRAGCMGRPTGWTHRRPRTVAVRKRDETVGLSCGAAEGLQVALRLGGERVARAGVDFAARRQERFRPRDPRLEQRNSLQ